MSKTLEIGSLIVTDRKDGSKGVSLALGRKNKGEYSKYDLSVEVIVRDASGKVVSQQKDGFINLVDPRTRPDELLKAGVISEEVAEKMRGQASRTPDKIKYVMQVSRTAK